MRKPRPDSKLKLLPEAVQDAIVACYRAKSAEDTVEWIKKEFKVSTSTRAVSDFYSWYHTTKWIEKAKSFADDFAQKASAIGGNVEQVRKMAQVAFEVRALELQDPKLFIGMAKVRQNDERIAIDRAVFARESCKLFLSWYSDKRAQKIAESDMPNSEKIDALRRTYFADVDELEKSGEVKLPK